MIEPKNIAVGSFLRAKASGLTRNCPLWKKGEVFQVYGGRSGKHIKLRGDLDREVWWLSTTGDLVHFEVHNPITPEECFE